jgi:hypothetical protein
VDEVRLQATNCKSAYTNPDGQTETITSIVDFTATAGIDDAYGVCIDMTKPNDKDVYPRCTALLTVN